MNVRIGFGDADLWSCFDADRPLENELRVLALAAVDGPSISLLLVADLEMLWPAHCRQWRESVARSCNVPPHAVGIFSTQNHAAPPVLPSHVPSLAGRFQAAAHEAMRAAVPAEMAYVHAHPPGLLNRRKPLGEWGSFSFFYGFDENPDGSANCSRLLRHAIGSLCEGSNAICRTRIPGGCDDHPPIGVEDRLALDLDDPSMPPAQDPLAQGLFFRTPDGHPIGGVARWAAHPVASNAADLGYGGDYPCYTRRRLKEKFGGHAMFLTGPCGNQAPLVHRKSLTLARTIGAGVADALLKELPGGRWQSLNRATSASHTVHLPVQPFALTTARGAVELQKTRRLLHRLIAQTAPLPDIKSVQERLEHLGYVVEGTFQRWCGIDLYASAGRPIAHDLFALKLESTTLLGLPGEPFGRFSTILRNGFDSHPLLVIEECNGYLGYIPTADEYPQGGYEIAAALLTPQAEAVLLEEATRLVRQVRGPKTT